MEKKIIGYKFTGNGLCSFTKTKIYQLIDGRKLNDPFAFLDNDGEPNGMSPNNDEYFQPVYEDDEAALPISEIEQAKQILINAGYIGVNSMFSSNNIIGRCVDRDLDEPTKEQINLIISILDRQFNASEGLNWDTIDNAIDEVLEPSID